MHNRSTGRHRRIIRPASRFRVLASVIALAAACTAGIPVPGAAASPVRAPAPRASHAALAVAHSLVRHLLVPRSYVIRPGDTLSGIAFRLCSGQVSDWTGIWHVNRQAIPDPDLIYPGQHIQVACSGPPAAWHAPAAVSHAASHSADADDAGHLGTSGGTSHAGSTSPGSSGFQVSSSFQQCVITRESGGNAQIWNASGHYGLYQFAYGTWVAAGGAPSLFGHASAAYQTQVFWQAYRLWGASPWAPSDGCSL